MERSLPYDYFESQYETNGIPKIGIQNLEYKLKKMIEDTASEIGPMKDSMKEI